MRFLKLLLGTVAMLGMTTCHPVMAMQDNKVALTATSCQVADQYARDTIHLIQDGKSNIEIMSWLDSVTPDVNVEPQGYLGVLWTKLNVSNLRVALSKAYKEGVIRQKSMNNCLDSVNQEFMVVRK